MFSPPSHCCPRILTTNFHTYKALVSTVILVNNFKKPLHFFKINPQSSLFKKIKNFPHRRVSHTKRLDLFFPHVISYLLHTQPTIQPPQMFSPPHCCCCILTLNFTSPYPSPLTSPRLFRTTIKKTSSKPSCWSSSHQSPLRRLTCDAVFTFPSLAGALNHCRASPLPCVSIGVAEQPSGEEAL